MHMVRHDTIGVDEERTKTGMFSQTGDEPRREARVCAEAAAIIEAEGDEIHGSAAIAAGRKPNVLVLEFRQRGHIYGAKRVCRAEGRGATFKSRGIGNMPR